jgi:hypothetical protein
MTVEIAEIALVMRAQAAVAAHRHPADCGQWPVLTLHML